MGSILGWTNVPRYPFLEEQSIGSILALFIIVLWAGRRYFKDILLRVIGLSRVDDSNEL